MENWSDGVMEKQRPFSLGMTEKAAETPLRVLDLNSTSTLQYSNRKSANGIAIQT
jgi:hypothetical protein